MSYSLVNEIGFNIKMFFSSQSTIDESMKHGRRQGCVVEYVMRRWLHVLHRTEPVSRLQSTNYSPIKRLIVNGVRRSFSHTFQ